MAHLNNPHDRFFKVSFGDKLVVKAFLRKFLPIKVLTNLNLDTLEIMQSSYINDFLEEHISDLVYKCTTKDNAEQKISLLFEHKSYSEPFLVFQLLQYITSAYWHQIRNKETPTPVIPIVLTHGASRINKKKIERYFKEYPSDIIRYIPKFDYEHINLSTIDAPDLKEIGNHFLYAALLAFKYSHNTGRLLNQMNNIVESLLQSHSRNLNKTFFVYFNHVADIDSDKLIKLIKTMPQPLKSDAMSIHDTLIEEGKEIGKEIGKKDEKAQTAFNLIKENMSNELICKVLGVSNDFVENIRQNRINN